MRNYTEVPTITDDQLKFWSKALKNVLIYGDHGVGKTSIIKNFWDKTGINYVMLSGATLDPWTDLVGVPAKIEKNGRLEIEYALPSTINDDMEGLFIDEINRAPAKVRNALMELLLTRSINGRKFKKLKYIWAAANPPDSENNYDVEELDPAQEDRFDIIVRLSNRPYPPYFVSQFGETVAEKALQWHENLSDDMRAFVSPRRLEMATDYVINHNGNPRDVFPHKGINVTAFAKAIKGDARIRALVEAVDSKDDELIKNFFSDLSKVQGCVRDIIPNYRYAYHFVKYGDMEQLIGIAEGEPRLRLVLAEAQRDDKIEAIEAYRKIHNTDPIWHSDGHSQATTARNSNAFFSSQLESFSNPSPVEIRIPDLASEVGIKPEEEILEDFKAPSTLVLSPVSYASAMNGIRFGIACFRNSSVGSMERESQIKLYGLIYSSFNYYYERDGHILGAIYDVPHAASALKTVPNILKRGNAASPLIGGGTRPTARSRRPAGRTGGSSGINKEEDLL